MELRDIVREYKYRYHLSNKELADRFSVTHITVGRWLRGEVKTIQEETAQNMSQVLGFDVQAVLQGTIINLKRPILGVAKAGYDLYLQEDYLGEESVTLQEYQAGDYFLRVSGNSMINAGILDGSLVYVTCCDSLTNGDIGIVMIGEEVTIKRYVQENKKIVLIAENPEIENKEFTLEEAQTLPLRILGKVLFAKTYVA